MQHNIPTNPHSFIGMLRIDPHAIGEEGSYLVELPIDSRPLTVGVIEEQIVMWVMAPHADEVQLVKHRLWIVPGGRRLRMQANEGLFIGTVIVANGSECGTLGQDWHVFFDNSGAPVLGTPQSTYTVH
jgi:hypothetical protein